MKELVQRAQKKFEETMKSLRQRQRGVLDRYATQIDQKKIDYVRKKLG
jgi:hypothetical protein